MSNLNPTVDWTDLVEARKGLGPFLIENIRKFIMQQGPGDQRCSDFADRINTNIVNAGEEFNIGPVWARDSDIPAAFFGTPEPVPFNKELVTYCGLDGESYESSVYRAKYSSLDSFYVSMANGVNGRDFKNRCTASERAREGAGFSGAESFGEALDLACGWPEGAEEILRYQTEIMSGIADMIAKPTYFISDDPSGSFDVQAFMSGEPEYWINEKASGDPSRRKGQIVSMLFSSSCAGSVQHDTIVRRGAVALSIADALERAGYAVAIDIEDISSTTYGKVGNGSVAVHIAAKRSDEVLDIARMAFPMIHPAFLRRLMFKAVELAPQYDLDVSDLPDSSYGYPVPVDYPMYDIVFPAMKASDESKYSSDKRALDEAKKALNKFNVMIDAKDAV